MDKYAYYQTEDFLRDDSFVNWVLDPEGADNQQWTEWMNSNPVKKEAAQKAMHLIRSFEFKKKPVADRFYADLKNRIDQTIASRQPRMKTARVIPAWLKVAAVVAAVTTGILVWRYLLRNDWNTISTPYAAIKSVQLPDGSTAVLNAHSTIRFHKDFAGHQREVWLTGEAFFEVRHITLAGKAQRFVVHAGATDVEVLGTEFNVKTGDHTTGVMLRRGKVQFGVPNTTLQTIMQPNDYCQYNTTPQGITTRVVNPVLFTGWMEHKYRFENTSAYEVCRTLEEYFGYEFIIKKTSMIDQRISGTLELSNEQVMFSALGVLLNASVAKSGNKVIIR